MVIYNTIKHITLKNEPKKDENSVNFGYLGSWSALKNIPFLIETFAELNKKYPQIKLILNKYVGEFGQDAQNVADTIERYKNECNLVSEEMYNDANCLFSNIDVLVLASHVETMPLVAIEAMSAEKCVIMTSNSGLHEFFDDNVHCLYINPNEKQSLYSAMEKVLNDKDLRLRIAKNGYEKVKSYNFNESFNESFYNLMNNKTP
jgi:glycosyltransferase involved in cell wall biosynthesis